MAITAVRIRAATVQDAERLSALAEQLGYPSTPAEITARMSRLRSMPGQSIVVAEREGRVVAWMTLSVERALESSAWTEIKGLVVDEAVRGIGIGALLVDWAKVWALVRGTAKLRVRTNQIRQRTHQFYESRGFTLTKSQRVYDLPLK